VRALVLVAHPCADGFARAAAARAVAGLERAGHDVDVIDLYASGFRAAMSREERAAYETDEPIVDAQVADHVARLQRAEWLVFVYPTWWSGLPAILKGWLDRVLVPGVGFVFNARGKVRPGLTHVRRIVGISTYGSPWFFTKLINDNGRRMLTRTLRVSTGLRARPTWLALYSMDSASVEDRTAFLDEIEQRMTELT